MARAWWVAPFVGSGLVLLGLIVRDHLSTTWPWLGYNVVLAWIPLLLGAVAIRGRWQLVALGPLWLLFLPNAPYLLTDLVHLRARPPVPLWFDTALLGGAGALGLWIGVVSLHQVASAVGRQVGSWAGQVLFFGAPLLAGFGMYLGRFSRWNSWDLWARPMALFADAIGPLRHPTAHPEAWAFTLTFGAVFLAAALAAPPRAAPEVVSSGG